MKEYRILKEMINLSKMQPKLRNYSQLLYTFAFSLLTISYSAYNFVQSELPLPDIRSVYRHASQLLTIKPYMLTNLSYLPDILEEYKNIINENESKSNLQFILAVDALSTTPFANIRKNLTVSGLFTDDITADESFIIEKSIQKFEDYLRKISDKIVNSLFVYSLHPINHNLPTFFIYILPYNSGKANNETTSKLFEISEICKLNDINIIGIASDGDTAMSKFHTKNIRLFETNQFNKSRDLLMFSDVLHLLKRARYHFVKSIHSKDDRLNKTNQLQNLFNIPKEILKNESYTKMHDSLAVRLFTIDNLLISIKNHLFDESLYMFPFCIFASAQNNQYLNVSERLFYFEIIKNFCLQIRKNNQIFSSFKYKIKSNIIHDLLSTVFSFIYLLKNSNSTIDFNRCSTAPLEHNFGIARINCKDNDRMDNLIKKFALLDIRRIDKFNFTKHILRHRVNNFGTQVNMTSCNVINYELIDNFSKIIISNIFQDFKNKNISENVSNFFNFIKTKTIKLPQESKFLCKSSDVYVNQCTVPNIQNRFKENITKQPPWSLKEINLLKRLINDIGANCTKLSNYFEKRSIKSICKKASSLYKKKQIAKKPFIN